MAAEVVSLYMAAAVLTGIPSERAQQYYTTYERVDVEATEMLINVPDRNQRRKGLGSGLVCSGTFVMFCLGAHGNGEKKKRRALF